MGRRWSAREENALTEVKRRLKDQLANRPQFPEVVGDRRLIRFIRAKDFNIDVACKMISNMLKWRDANHVDDIRQDIVYGGKDTPLKFPFGKTIIDIVPQIIITANSVDKLGRPLAMEMFNFSPKDVLDAITVDDYLVFLIYSLEYRAIVLEQLSHEKEMKYLADHPDPNDREDGYGVILLDYTIRDLKGVGFGHLGKQGRSLVGAALELGIPNYEEYLGKCVMINTPWIFNTFWYFVRGFLDEKTILKIDLTGSNYMPLLLEDMTFENIPERFGGGFKLYNEPFHFDKSPGGPLFCGPVNDNTSSNRNRKPNHFFPTSSLTIDTDGTEQNEYPERRLSQQSASSSGSTSPAREFPDTWHSVSSKQSFDRVSSTSSVTSSLTDPETPPRASLNQGSGGAARTAASLLFSRVSGNSNNNTSSNLPDGIAAQSNGRNSAPPSNGRPLTSIAERRAHPHSLNDLRLDTDMANSPDNHHRNRPEFDQREAVVHRHSGPSPTTSSSDSASLRASRSPGNLLTFSRENSPSNNPYSPFPPTTEKSEFMLVILLRAVGEEFYEFMCTLYLVLTQHPLKTVCSAAVVGAFLYLRLQDRLHLMVFPVMALVTLLYFEKIR